MTLADEERRYFVRVSMLRSVGSLTAAWFHPLQCPGGALDSHPDSCVSVGGC